MYIHPFELTDKKVNLDGISLFKKIRFGIGRKKNLKKLERLIKKSLKNKINFMTINSYIAKSIYNG